MLKITLVLALILNLFINSVFAQPILGPNIKAASTDNGGDLELSFKIQTPASKTLPPLTVRYNSGFSLGDAGQGWAISVPFIEQDASGAITIGDAITRKPVLSDPISLEYFTRTGARIVRLTNGSFAQYQDDGTEYLYGANINLSAGVSRWFLSSITARHGWKTSYSYLNSALNGLSLSQISVDANPNALLAPTFSILFLRQTVPAPQFERISAITVQTGSTVTRSYQIEYISTGANSQIKRVRESGIDDFQVGVVGFSYYTSGYFQGLMAGYSTALGGEYRYNYNLTPVTYIETGQQALKKTLSAISTDNGLGLLLDSTFSYQNGYVSGSQFLGFNSLRFNAPNYSSRVSKYKLGLGGIDDQLALRGLPYLHEHLDSNGNLINQAVYRYVTGGAGSGMYALELEARTQYSNAGTPKTQVRRFNYDFQNRRINWLEELGDCVFNPQTFAINDTDLSDNAKVLFNYLTGNTTTNVRNLISEAKALYHDGTKLREVLFEYQGADLWKTHKWINTSNSYLTTTLTLNSTGSVSEIKAPNGTVTKLSYQRFLPTKLIDDALGIKLVSRFYYDQHTLLPTRAVDPSGLETHLMRDKAGRVAAQYLVSSDQYRNINLTYLELNGVNTALGNYFHLLDEGVLSTIHLDGFGVPVQERHLGDTENSSHHVRDLVSGTNGFEKISNFYISNGVQYTATSQAAGSSLAILHDPAGRAESLMPELIGNGIGATTLAYEVQDDARGLQITDGNLNPRSFLRSGSSQNLKLGSGVEETSLTLTKDLSAFVMLLSDGANNTFSYQFNSLGQIVETNPATSTPVSITYGLDNQRFEVSDALGQKVRFERDGLGRLKKRSSLNSSAVEEDLTEYYYDTPQIAGFRGLKGRVTVIDGQADRVDFDYSTLGDIKRLRHTVKDTAAVFDFSFLYDEYGRVIEVIYPNGASIVNQYDQLGRFSRHSSYALSTIFPAGELTRAGPRNGRGNMLQRYWGNGVEEELRYHEPSGALSFLRVFKAGQTYLQEQYGYDQVNQTSISVQTPSTQSSSQYAFDSQNRVKQISSSFGTQDIEWDSLGRIEKNEAKHPGLSLVYGDPNIPYKPSQINSTTQSFGLTYNANNQLVHAAGPNLPRNFQYYSNGLIRSVTMPNANVDITYGVLGNILKTVQTIDGVTTKRTYLGPGLADIVETLQSSKLYLRVYGELSAGGPGLIATLEYPYDPNVNLLLSAGNGNTGDGPAAPIPPKPKASPVIPPPPPNDPPYPTPFPTISPWPSASPTPIPGGIKINHGSDGEITSSENGATVPPNSGTSGGDSVFPFYLDLETFRLIPLGPCGELAIDTITSMDATDWALLAGEGLEMETGLPFRSIAEGMVCGTASSLRDHMRRTISGDNGFLDTIYFDLASMENGESFLLNEANQVVDWANSVLKEGKDSQAANMKGVALALRWIGHVGIILGPIEAAVGQGGAAATRAAGPISSSAAQGGRLCPKLLGKIFARSNRASTPISDALSQAARAAARAPKPTRAYHYCTTENFIRYCKNGISNSENNLYFGFTDITPLQAHIDFALPGMGPRNFRFQVDFDSMMSRGLSCDIRTSARDFGMTGGGTEAYVKGQVLRREMLKAEYFDFPTGKWQPIEFDDVQYVVND